MPSVRKRSKIEIRAIMSELDKRDLLFELNKLCREYHVPIEDVLSMGKTRQVVIARDACVMRLLDTGFSLTEVGRIMHMDPSSIVDVRRRVTLRLARMTA